MVDGELSFCSASAPALRKFDKELWRQRARGHREYTTKTKRVRSARLSGYREGATGFHISIAFDPDWRTLKSWLHGVDTG